ncbi:MAG TPA: alpha-L-arabinofuranosidase C-terminal domain-containing protein [Bryobacteraceae bacterium]|nr:alpha-L-arabinofuranosidase C-terminal domain-containing protein [Bryobacteraceae bacterium]
MITDRRTFLRGLAAFGLAASGSRSQPATGESSAHIEILPDEPIGVIAPEIYGHFIEHLGGVIYDGVWVGEASKIPNEGGIRRAVIDALKAIHAPVVRWPGGCFADSYNWRDGIGSAADRKSRTNFWGGVEPNAFGTQEFLRFCSLTGAKPYLAANLRGLPAWDFQQWVEYCNSPAGSTTLAQQRAAQGHPEPYDVRYWGVGNESWGCGGNFTPDEYATEFRRFTAWLPQYGGHERLDLVASGPSDREVDWTRRLLHSLAEKRVIDSVYGLSLHYYTWNLSAGLTADWDLGKRDALTFDELEWYELLSQGDVMDAIIRDHWAVMAESDRNHHIKLIVDEWGAWYRPGTEVGPKYGLSQMLTLRDALLSGLTLDIFQRHADKVSMANAAQLINCLHSLMLAREDQFVLTPVYHVFKMYMAHMGARSVRAEFAAPPVSYDRRGQPGALWGLNGSASISGKNVTLTVVNPHTTRALEAEVVVRGATVASAAGQVLTNADIHAHNDFQHPDVVHPEPVRVTVEAGRLRHRFPPASVTSLSLTCA